MEKISAVLVVLNKNILKDALISLNCDKLRSLVVLIDDGNGKILSIKKTIKAQILSFAYLNRVVGVRKNSFWLICGQTSDIDDIDKMKNFLTGAGVPEEKIVNVGFIGQINPSWIGNLRFVAEGGANCFATGNSFVERGLDFQKISGVKGVNLASSNQDLRQSFLTAQHIFKTVKRSTIKFVFIGLAPYALSVDNRKNFSTSYENFIQSLLLKENLQNPTAHETLLENLLDDKYKEIFQPVTSEQADLNFDKIKALRDKKISVDDMTHWQEELSRLTKPFDEKTAENNLRILEDYIKLCLDNGAKPVGIIFPFATVLQENYNREILFALRRELRRLEKIYDFTIVDMFDAQTDYENFADMSHLNLKGAQTFSEAIDFRLRGKNFLPIEKISEMNYAQIFKISNIITKDAYNQTVDNYFAFAAEKIRGKKKIRVGFVSDDPSMWCGDALFNLFAKNERCETTLFLCLQKSLRDQPIMVEDFERGLKGFKARGIKVVAVKDDKKTVSTQDLLIMLRPYFEYMPKAFELSSIGAETLMTYIPYGFNTCVWNIYDTPIYHLGWKLFFDTKFHINLLEEKCRTGMPRGIYSGYTKLDVFYDDKAELKFDWKMTRPDAKKIIYAPHWSIASGIFYSTFQWNYKFMYEFARTHPETSWVFKPHPMLFGSAVGHGLFKSEESFKNYLKDWDNLPNAQVFTGPYYQGLFATSDGMIMDCGSWIGEYQYTHKPMIFLTRDTQKFNRLGEELMKILYRVDGKNLKEISALMQKIFIDGNDELFDERMKFFDEHMNYMKENGTSASEFIFRTISKELRL